MKRMYWETLPKHKFGNNKGMIDWENSVGCEVNFEYDNIKGVVKIENYENEYLKISINGNIFDKEIYIGDFKKCKIKRYLIERKTIWDEARWMCDLGVSEEDAKKYTKMSRQKIKVVCPLCGNSREVRINNICTRRSISCECGDGVSYPQKIMFSLLKQLNVDFEVEYKPKYLISNGGQKRSDFYIPNMNLVIETDGVLGHKGGRVHSKSNETLDECVKIDEWKDAQHLINGIKTIRINCFKSDLEYIKNNILNSELNNIFDLSNINWNKCEEFALKNRDKKVCDLFNKGDKGIKEISKIFKLAECTIRRILNKGNKLGWCNYDNKENRDKKNREMFSKKVSVYKNGEFKGEYKSMSELARISEKEFGIKFDASAISKVCRGEQKAHKGYTFKYSN